MSQSPENEHPQKAFGWAARDITGILSPFNFSRRTTSEEDVSIKVMYCGICHSDLHAIKNDWGNTSYPIVPGHEIVGVVTEVGCKVKKFKVGDKVGVGCMVGACNACDDCNKDLENYCPKMIYTYNSTYHDGTKTYGGYSDIMVANERYVVLFPENLPLDAGAPLLCAGITVYSPLKYYGVCKPGMHLGVVGLGGLGHVAVKFGKAFGMKVTVISTSAHKKVEAIKRLGADSFLVSRDPEQLKAAVGTMDGILDTVSAVHSLLPLLGLLKTHGKLIMVGGPERPLEILVFPLITGRKSVGGTLFGGMKETQEMVDFAAEHNITADIEVIPMDYVNTAMDRLARGDVKYRHEIVGVVTEVGSKVKKFKVGDKVGVGCMVGACNACDDCNKDLENYCPKMIYTYNSTYHDGTKTYGGYSDIMVANERYVVLFPENLPLDAGAPLLCAGITVYSPLKYYGVCKPGMHLGVVGLGGLGHVAVKFGKAFGMKVTVISTSAHKKVEAIKRLGADSFLVSRDPEQLKAAVGTMDGILDTVSAVHSLLPLLGLLKTHGKLIMVGGPERPLEILVFPLITGRKSVGGTLFGGMKETQEMVDFAAEHNITADIEVIPMDYVNTAMDRLARGDVKYRFVINVAGTLSTAA